MTAEGDVDDEEELRRVGGLGGWAPAWEGAVPTAGPTAPHDFSELTRP